MKINKLKLVLSVVLALSLLIVFALPIHANNYPTVTITVKAKVIAATNTEDTWDIGIIAPNAVVYFSATGERDDDYSQIENTGNVAIDIEIQGTDLESGSGNYDWTLSNTGTAGSETYALQANSEANPTSYNITVKSSSYNDLITNLAPGDTHDWSMKFTAPTAFNSSDDGTEKSATVTLAISESTPSP